MAAVTRTVVRQDGDNRMTNETNNPLTPVVCTRLDVCQWGRTIH
jgi:hypothetical protein